MSTNIVFNGSSYSIPSEGDSNWASDLTNYLIAIANGSLQKTGGTFTLTSEIDFGANYGLKLSYIKSRGSNPASSGVVRLANAESLKWRNAANNADLDLTVNASNALQFNGSSFALSGSIVDADINASAAIAYSKLNLATSIVNADISNSAAIAYSKLNLSTSILNADINASAAIAYSKLNLATSILNADINASAAIALSKLATVTASRALVSDGSGFVSASSVTSTELGRLSGIGSTAVGISDAQVLTNKDIDGGTASNTNRFTLAKNTLTNLTALSRKQGTLVFDTTSNKPYYDDGSNLRVIGSGSGSGGNLIDDGDAEAGIANYTEGSYSAATRPSGTFTASSGASAFAISTTSSSPLSGNNSFVLTKSSGASRQGRVVERTINLDLENRAKVLEVRIKYIVSSGSFVAGSSSSDSSLIWYIGQYNGSTWTYTEPSSFKMLSSSTTISDVLIGNFQTNSDTTQVKLIAYVAETANSAWAVKCEVSVQPCNYVYGTPITDWVAYTPTITGLGTPASQSFYARRVGDSRQVKFVLTSGTNTAATVSFTLPNNETIDSNKIGGSTVVGKYNASATTWNGAIFKGASNSLVYFGADGTAYPSGYNGNNFANATTFGGYFEVPISGWSSSVQMSDGYDGRLIAAQATTSSQTITAGGTRQIVNASTVTYDKTNSVTTGASWKFTAPSQGLYELKYVQAHTPATYTTGAALGAELFKNGSVIKPICGYMHQAAVSAGPIISGSVEIELNAGDYIDVRSYIGGSINATINGATIYISKKASPTTISATEKFVASYTDNSAQAITVPNQVVGFNTLKEDTHGIKTGTGTGTQFTIPVSGSYRIDAYLSCDTTTTAGNQYWMPKIYVGGVAVAEGGGRFPNSHQFATGHVFYEDVFAAGTVITIAVDTNVGASRSLTNSVLGNRVLITRIK